MYNYEEKNIDSFEKELLEEKKLLNDDKLNDRYFLLYKNYRMLLDKYLLQLLPLKGIDDILINSALSFIPVKGDNMDFYQQSSSMNLKFIYLRNDTYVEKLSNDDIDFIVNLSEENLLNPSSDALNLIKRTFNYVIDSNFNNDDVVINKCYGLDIDKYWIDSCELVFGIRYDVFNDNGLSDEEWSDNYFNQCSFLEKLISEFELKCSGILNIGVNFLTYDDNFFDNIKTR